MTVTAMRDTIACPTCGSVRVVSARQRRRSAAKGHIPCAGCRGQTQTRSFREGDLGFWLRAYDSVPPKGMSARDFITAGGAPAELVQLARSAFPDARR